MANIQSAKKRIRQTKKRTVRNKMTKSETHTYARKVMEAIQSGNKKAAEESFQVAMQHLHSAVSKGVLHRNTVGRKLSRMHKKIAAMS